MDNWFNILLVKKLQDFNNIISNNGENNSGFSVGDKLSLADISIYVFLVEFFDNKEGVLLAYQNCEKLKNIVKTVENDTNIADWLKNRPVGSY
jgi:glutathione S-transferase